MDIKLLPARVNDLKEIVRRSNLPKYMGFLNPEETSIAIKCFNQGEEYKLFGGYEGAERVVLGVLPDWCETPIFPIKAISFKYRECDRLSHRDFLGALMALGITRETIGDILVENGRAVVFATDEATKYILTQLNKVGNVGVVLNEGYTEPLPSLGIKQEFSVTVASTRIDCVVAAICNMSRNVATEKITDGLVSVNSICVTKPTLTIREGDKISIRQKGRFEIISHNGYSKSGRIILKYNKYV
ncbi:MAG: hypothetical protein E7521_03320 [Ruminococcaceae bacterium]|nr:hypothetical protein [Oscillospiraceae bacterium]